MSIKEKEPLRAKDPATRSLLIGLNTLFFATVIVPVIVPVMVLCHGDSTCDGTMPRW